MSRVGARIGRLLTAAVVLVVCAPSAALAAPALGTWEGTIGPGTLRFDVVERGGQRVLTNLVRACGPHTVDHVSIGYPTSFPIGRDGRLRPVGLHSGQRVPIDGRLDGARARIKSGLALSTSGARGEWDCDFGEHRFTVRRIQRTVVPRTGHWVVQTPLPVTTVGGPKPSDATFEVTRDGSVMEFGPGEFGGPLIGRELGVDVYCDGGYVGELFVARDGSFSLPATSADFRILSGRFTSPTSAEGTYQTIREGSYACDSGPQPFTAHLEGAAPEPVTPPPPPPEEPPEQGCRPEVTLGQVHVTGACLRKHGQRYVAEGAVRVNGLDLTPQAGATLTFDPGQLEIRASGQVTVRAGDIVLFSGPFAWSARAGFDLRAAGTATLKGLPISGRVSGRWVPDGATLTANVSLGPDFGAITGETTLHATMADGLALDSLSVSLSDTDLRVLGRLALKAASLRYTAESNEWVGAAKIELPGGRGVAGELAIQDGAFKRASAEVSNLNLPLGQVLYLQSIGLSVQVRPLAFSGSVGFTGGPKLSVLGRDLSALEGTGSFSWTDGALYDTWTIGGDLSLASFSLGDAKVTYHTGLDLTFSGRFGFEIVRAGFTGSAEGWIEGASAFQAQATGELSLPLIGGAEARALVSSTGLGACGTKKVLFGSVSGGVSYRWGGSPHMFTGGCDFSDVEVPRSSGGRAAQAGGPGIRLRGGGRDVVLLAVRGAGGAPHVSVSGPGGLAIAAGPDGAALTDRAYLLESPAEKTTYVVVSHPAPGRYAVAPLEGSVPVRSVGKAEQLPAVRVRARVRRTSGGRRVLRWRLRRIPGQRVRFVERGDGVAHTIATTGRRSGSVRFRPALGPAGARTVEAVVSQRGVPRAQLQVGAFRVGASRAARATRVRARRHRGGRLVVRWRHPGRVTGFDVVLRERSGRKALRTASARARKVTFRGVGRRDRGTVAVVARGLGHDTARPARDRFGRGRR